MASILFRIVTGLNFIRFALSFSPEFEGTSAHAGIGDQLFNPNHDSGFRLDFVWLVISTFVILLATVWFIPGIKRDRRARINVPLGLTWMIPFAIYLVRALTSGILDFG